MQPDEDPDERPFAMRTLSARLGALATALILVLITGWMYWIVTTFVDGNTWFDFGVKTVLFELIFSAWLFAGLLALNAVLALPWLEHAVEKAVAKLAMIVWVISAVGIITFVLASTVVPLMMALQ